MRKKSIVFFRISIIFLLLYAMSACGNEDVSVHEKNEKIITKDDFFEISETGCLGECPNYSVQVFGDGAFVYQNNLAIEGSKPIHGKLASEDVKKIFLTIDEFGFEKFSKLEIMCKQYALDRGTRKMHLRLSGKVYYVKHHYGCVGFDGEEKLRQFEGNIDNILKLQKIK